MTHLGADWFVPLLRASQEVHRFMLLYRPSGEMDERGITTHVARLAKQFEASGTWPALSLKFDAVLKDEGAESVHGADYEVTLKGGGLLATFRLQAKRLFPLKTRPGNYKHLDHEVGGRRQVDLLIEKAGPARNAGYIFYNGLERSVATVASGCCSPPPENSLGLDGLGLTLAPAEAISQRWGQCAFEDVFDVSVPVACLGRCEKLWQPQVNPNTYMLMTPQPWYLPLFSALTWTDLTLLSSGESSRGRLVRTGEGLAEDAVRALEWVAPYVQVLDDGAPPYLERLIETGETGLDPDQRPAQVVAVLDADPRDVDEPEQLN